MNDRACSIVGINVCEDASGLLTESESSFFASEVDVTPQESSPSMGNVSKGKKKKD